MSEHNPGMAAAAMAAKLSVGAMFDLLGFFLAVLTVGAMTFIELTYASLALLTIAGGAAASVWWFGARVRYDREIFSIWASRWRDPDAPCAHDMQTFDRLIGRNGPSRPIEARAAGASRLMNWQQAMLVLQFSAFLLALVMGT